MAKTTSTQNMMKKTNYTIDIVDKKGNLTQLNIQANQQSPQTVKLKKGDKISIKYADGSGAPESIYTTIDNDQLNVYLDSDEQPDLVLEQYSKDQYGTLFGNTENGSYYEYTLDVVERPLGYYPNGGDWLTLTGDPLAALFTAGAAAGMMSATNIGLGVLGIAAVAAAAGGGGGSSDNSATPNTTVSNTPTTTPVESTTQTDRTPPTASTVVVNDDKDPQQGVVADGGKTNDKTPTISGQVDPAEAGGTVTVQVGSQTLTATIGADGKWSVTATDLTDGLYTANVIVKDTSGNTSTPSTSSFTLDGEPSGTVQLSVGSDTGKLGDGITSVDMPTITGTTEKGALVDVTVNNIHYTANADGNGDWSVVVNDTLADGKYTVAALFTDIAGNTATANTNIEIDTNAPSLSSFKWQFDNNKDNVINAAEYAAGNKKSGITLSTSALHVGDIINYAIEGAPDTPVAGATPIVVTQDMLSASTLTLDTVDLSGLNGTGQIKALINITDVAGNDSGTLSKILTLDTTTFVTVATKNALVSGTCEALSTVKLIVNGKTYSDATTPTGAWDIALPADSGVVAGQSYNASVLSTDKYGNTASASFTLLI